jgi:eukaryotic-like serine/threonine-protein kinase
MRLTPGATLGPSEVLSPIGAGGMGEVCRARHPRLNREVAIKVLPGDRLEDEDRRRRFTREAHAAFAFNLSHIITIHEIEAGPGRSACHCATAPLGFEPGKSVEHARRARITVGS